MAAQSAVARGLRDAGALAGPGAIRARMNQAAEVIDALATSASLALDRDDVAAGELGDILRAALAKAGCM